MLIVIPKEILPEEKRVAATPETVKKYIDLGFTVAVEAGAGEGVLISDDAYRSAGAAVAADIEKMFAEADVVLKVKQPEFNQQKGKHEVGMLRNDSILIPFDIPQDLAVGIGGYAKSLGSDWLAKERSLIAKHLADVDVVILSALVPGEVAPVLITREMVATMKPGSVIIDVSVDQGGNCEATEPGQFIEKHGVHICGIQNIPGRMAVHASWLYANNLYYYVENLFKKGNGEIDLDDEIVRNSLVTYQSRIVHEGALKAMQ